MVTSTAVSEMINGVWRIKWWKYRYVLIAALLLNLLLINHFFFDNSATDLNPFREPPTTTTNEVESEAKPLVPAPLNSPPQAPEILPEPPEAPPVAPEIHSEAQGFPSEALEASPEATEIPPESLEVPQAPEVSPPEPPEVTPAPAAEAVSTSWSSAASSSPSLSPAANSTSTSSKKTFVVTKTFAPETIPTSSSTFNLHDYDFDGEYVGWPLERVCKETTWVPGLTFVCDNNSGGIGNIRNFILTCVRYAIDAGASQLILPRIQRRSEEDLANIFTTGFQPFDYFFDEEHFRAAIGTFCSQMTIYDTPDDIPHADVRLKIGEFYPKDLGDLDGCDGRGVNRHLDMFRPKFDNWLNTTRHTPNATHPVTIRFKWATFFEWPIYRDGPEFAATFGDILRFRKDIQVLAAKTLAEMSRFVGVEPNGEKLNAPYLGVHLRTESDALGFWPNFKEQSEGYLAQADQRHIKHAYLACGNATEGQRFADMAWERLKLNVTTKLDLLKEEDLQQLTALSWDQQALVDFLVLTKSTHFTGCSFSSFTMNIAFKRHLMTAGLQTRPWKSPGDEFTTLIGRFESWYGDWMFMYECMWP